MRKNQQSRIYYHGGDWHRATMAIAEIVAFEKGYRSTDVREALVDGPYPDLLIRKTNPKRRRAHGKTYTSYADTTIYAIEVIDTSAPEKDLGGIIRGITDVLEIRRTDLDDPDSLTAIFAHCRRRIP